MGWAFSKKPDAELATAALGHAVQKHNPDTSKLMFHSDQRVQYSARKFVGYLDTLGITQSMSRRGNCWDYAVMERFFRSLKAERLNHVAFINHNAVAHTVESYIRFYNYGRLHSAIDYQTPHQQSQQLKRKMKKAA